MLYNVLCIDESGTTGIELLEMLSKLNIKVVNAKDKVSVSDVENKFDFSAIICIVESEELRELDYIKDLKLKDFFCNLPVIAISNYPDRRCILKAIDSGVNEFIAKPYNKDILLNKICGLLGIDKVKECNRLDYLNEEDIITFSFSEMFNKEVKAASRGGYPVSIMLANIASRLNDSVNVINVNEITNNLYRVTKTKLRDTDTVFVYGKSGLAMLLPFADKQGAITVDGKIKHAFENHTLLKDYNVEYKLITSIASFPEDGKIQQKLLEKAQIGLI